MCTIARYSVIADVGSTLLRLLRDNLADELIDRPEAIGLYSPAEENSFKLILYLYHMEENHELTYAGIARTASAPLTLDLYYLLTAKSSAEINSKALDENTILGSAMQVLHENRVLSGSALEGALATNNDEIKISLVDLEHHYFSSKIKESDELMFRNAVCYKVGPVAIGDSLLSTARRVTTL